MKLCLFDFLVLITNCASFLRKDSDLDAVTVEVHLSEGNRKTRAIDHTIHPQFYDLTFDLERSSVHLHLQRNDEIHTNVPTLILDQGKLQEIHLTDSEESIFYQDIEKGAILVVQYDKERARHMFGAFHTIKGRYTIQSAKPDNTSSQLGTNKFHIIKEPVKQVHYDDIQYTRTKIQNFKTRRRQKRATGSQQIELLIVCDYSVYRHWYDKSKKLTVTEKEEEALTSVRQFYAFVINGMDAMYANIQTSSYTMSVVYAGIVIAKTPENSTWTEDIKNISSIPNRVNATECLSNFNTWVKDTPGLPNNDHVMLFTKYDLTNSAGSSGLVGLAYLETTCSENSQSIVEDGFDFIMITTASHELGHSLSAFHDGTDNTCYSEDGYIMAVSNFPKSGSANSWIFSVCSTAYFTNFLDSLDDSNTNCLKVLGSDFDPTALSPYNNSLAGQVFDADSQCMELYNASSYMCRGQYNNDFSTICTVLWCFDPNTASSCVSHVAGDGTLCGSKKWCRTGLCTVDDNAPSGDNNCLYGDRKGTIFTNGWTCADMSVNSPDQCQTPTVAEICCGSCAPDTTMVSTTPTKTSSQSIMTTAYQSTSTSTSAMTTTHAPTTTETSSRAIATVAITSNQESTSTVAMTTQEPTTTLATTKIDITSTAIGTTNPETSTTTLATTKKDITSTAVGTTTQEPTTTTPQKVTTTVPTTTLRLTTKTFETTTQEDNTSVITKTKESDSTTVTIRTKEAVTTTKTTRMTPTTTAMETTTTVVSTTQVPTTTVAAMTTSELTSTLETTTQEPNTTTVATTTHEPKTSMIETTTQEAIKQTTVATTTHAPTSTAVAMTTVKPTTTSTKELSTTALITTIKRATTTYVETKTEEQTTFTAPDQTSSTTITTNESTTHDNVSDEKLIIIIGGAIGGVLVFIFIIILCVICYKRNNTNSKTKHTNYEDFMSEGMANPNMVYDDLAQDKSVRELTSRSLKHQRAMYMYDQVSKTSTSSSPTRPAYKYDTSHVPWRNPYGQASRYQDYSGRQMIPLSKRYQNEGFY